MNGKNNIHAPEDLDESLDIVLNDIRQVIKGEAPNIDILELTEKVIDTLEYPSKSESQKLFTTSKVANESYTNTQTTTESRQTLENLIKLMEKPEANLLSLELDKVSEDVLTELLKLQLSEWLNHNLPSIVTEIVQKEIRKLISQNE